MSNGECHSSKNMTNSLQGLFGGDAARVSRSRSAPSLETWFVERAVGRPAECLLLARNRHLAARNRLPLCPQKPTFSWPSLTSGFDPKATWGPQPFYSTLAPVGLIFWFSRNRLVGSYLFLSSTSHSYFSGQYAAFTRSAGHRTPLVPIPITVHRN